MVNRRDPFQDMLTLNDAITSLMRDAVVRPGAMLSRSTDVPMNIFEQSGGYVVQVALPGVNPSEVDVTSHQNTLTVKGHRSGVWPTQEAKEKTVFLLAEFGPIDFERTVVLPKDVDAERIDAAFERGVLTIHLPIAEHAQPKRITIKEGSRSVDPPLTIKELVGNSPSVNA